VFPVTALCQNNEAYAGATLRELPSELQKQPEYVEKIKQLANVRRHEVNALLPETALCIERVLQSAAKGRVQDSVSILFALDKGSRQHQCLRPSVQINQCKELVVSMLQAASQNECFYRNSYSVSQMVCWNI
jgi:hypothetical protein